MANDIVLSAASRANLLSLQGTQKAIDITQLRLATGKKVNSALDNPQSFFQANSLNNRAGDLTRLLDGIGQSIRTIEAADKGITALTSLVEQASSVADAAQAEIRAAEGFSTITGTKDLRGVNLVAGSGGTITNGNIFNITVKDDDINSGTAVTVSITIATDDTVYDLVAKINDRVVNGANFSDNVRASVDSQGRLKIESLEEGAVLRISDNAPATSLGQDGYTFLGLDNVAATENTVATTRQGGTAIAGRVLTSKAADAASKVNGEFVSSATLGTATFTNGFATSPADAATLALEIDGTSYTIGTFIDTNSIQSVVDGVNSSAASDLVTARFNTTTGKIELAFADNVGGAELSWTAAGAGTVGFGFGTGVSDALMANGNVNSEAFKFIGSSANLDQYTKDFNKLRSQIDGIVEDANYRGVNLLGGDNLTSFFNEDRSNTLVTEGSDFTADGLGLDEADFTDAASIASAISQVSNALDAVRAFGSSISNDLAIIQTRQTFTQETINTLKAGAADLVNADLNEEGANLLALQTAQQLGVTSLSLASQSQQSVLRLF